ncbi:MAG TPA: NAD(P)-binding domain-containing protein [Kofleriaceae bacterium]|nr:NAD(P)-binding domain-containing protein [Kofleriaceae bacterium]
MTWVVPLALVGIAVAVMAVFTMLGAKKHKHGVGTAGRTATSAPAPRILVHDINDDRCTGCDACVAVCPTNVLDLVDNKSRVLHFQDCIQCEACMFACPTEALVMFPEGGTPPALKVPELDEHYQTAIKGQYLIGEVAGKPLVKNAANLGRAVVEHMLAGGLRSKRGGESEVDVAIIGSGPGGLSAALTCIQRGLRYVILEKEQLIASTIARYPKGKLVMAEPYDTENVSLLPVFDSSKEQLLPIWKELIERVGMKIKLGEAVEKIEKKGEGHFEIRTTVAGYRAQRVVLATGTRGKPRTLQVPGENLPKVANLLDDPDDHRGKAVLVVGGGDSAVEAALALADAGARVLISYRGRAFNRAQPKNKAAIEQYAAENRIKVKFNSQIVSFDADGVVLALGDGAQKRYPNDAAFILIGADPPVQWLGTLGVKFVERPHQYALGKSDDLVRRMLPTARPCPDDAANAATVVQGGVPDVDRAAAAISLPQAGALRAQAKAKRGEAPEPVSGPRKWLRSATGLFTGAGKKLEQPMPLSEFAKKQRFKTNHTGHGRRDALSPGERTRVLRMLRDEGARLADEDSRVELAPGGRNVRAMMHEDSPPPEPRLEKTGRPMPPMHLEDDLPPKQAVIVGLAKAMAQGPTTARTRKPTQPPTAMPPPIPGATPPGQVREVRAKRPSGSPPLPPMPSASPPPAPAPARAKRPSDQPVKKRVPPPMDAEPTRKLDPSSPLAQMLRSAQGAMPAVPKAGGFDDNETASHATRPAAMRSQPISHVPVAQRFDDESTRAMEMDPRLLDKAVAHDTHDELIDVGYLTGAQADGAIDLGHRDASRPFPLDDATAVADIQKLAALERARTAQARAPQRGGFHDEQTRTADEPRVKSLADVDWDID